MNISLTILVVSECRKKKGLEKTYIDFSNNTFPIDRGIIKLLCYIWEI